MKALASMLVLIALGMNAVAELPGNPVPVGEETRAEVHVGGMVRKPNAVKFTEGMDLQTAIEKAGGVNEFGSIKAVILLRDGERKTYNLQDPAQGYTKIEAGDSIEVPQKSLCG